MNDLRQQLLRYSADQLSVQSYLCFRLSNIDDLSSHYTKIFNHLSTHYDRVLMAQEVSNKGVYHIHGVVNGDNRDKLYECVSQILTIKGNKQYSIQLVKDSKQMLKYTLKEGDYSVKGFPPDLINLMYRLSNKKEDVKKKVSQLEEELLIGRISLPNFMTKYIKIQIDHGQNIYDQHNKAYFNRMCLKSGHWDYAEYVGKKYGEYFL